MTSENDVEIDDFMRLVARTGAAAAPWIPTQDDVIGERYVIKHQLGKGGAARVYVAYDQQEKRDVALKVFGRKEEDLVREVYATCRVLHPNVVYLYGYGDESRTSYLVLELLHGQTLWERQTEKGVIPLADTLQTLRCIADALTAAHEQDVSHRDLSYNNILWTDDNRIKVFDFGFADLKGQLRNPPSSRNTNHNSGRKQSLPRGGTPGFIPPEQWAGKDIAFKGDLFSLGVLTFWLVTNKLPFDGPSLGAGETATRLRSLMPTIPPQLDDLVARLLDPDPKARPAAKLVAQMLPQIRLGVIGAPKKVVVDNPFRPLRPFSRDDTNLFFGRDADTYDVCKLLAEHRVVILHGESGAGKSSLIQAGVRTHLADKMDWLDVDVSGDATRSPVEVLASCVHEEIKRRGATPKGTDAAALLLELARLAKRPLVLALDQFEEIFQRRTPEVFKQQAKELAWTLRNAIDPTDAPIRVLIAIRNDFHGYLGFMSGELPGVADHGRLLESLGPHGIRMAIEGAFNIAGFDLSPRLVEQMIRDFADHPVEMQLVCHGLYEKGKVRESRTMDVDDYVQIGGAERVLTQHIETVIAGWQPAQVSLARLILKRLVAKGGLRNAATHAEVIANEIEQPLLDVKNMLETLRADRLVVPVGGEGESEATWRIGHDKMALAVWEWLDAEERQHIEWREMLRANPYSPTEWWDWTRWWRKRPDERSQLLSWRAKGAKGANAEEKALLERLARYMKWAKRTPWIGGALAVAMVVVSVIMGVQRLKAAEHLKQEAKAQAEQAEMQKFNAQLQIYQGKVNVAESNAELELERDPGKTLAYVNQVAELRSQWHGGIDKILSDDYHHLWSLAFSGWRNGIGWVAAQHAGQVTKVMFSPLDIGWMQASGENVCENCWPNKKLVFSAGRDGKVRVLDLVLGGTAIELEGGATSQIREAVVAPNGRWIAASDDDSKLHVWEWIDENWKHRDVEVNTQLTDKTYVHFPMEKLAVSATGRWLAGMSDFGRVHVWDTKTWTQRIFWPQPEDIRDIAFSPRDEALFVLDEKSIVHVISPKDPCICAKPIPNQNKLQSPIKLTFSDEGNILAIGGDRVELFSTGSGNNTAPLQSIGVPLELPAGTSEMELIGGKSPSVLAKGVISGDLIWWQPQNKSWTPQIITHHDEFITRLTIRKDGKWIATSGRDSAVKLRQFSDLERWDLRGHAGSVQYNDVSPDNRFAASAGADGEVRIWELMPAESRTYSTRHGIMHFAGTNAQADPIVGLMDGTVATFDKNGEQQEIGKIDTRVQGICKWSNGRLAAGGANPNIHVWEANGSGSRIIKTTQRIAALLCLPDGRLISGHYKPILLWSQAGDSSTLIGDHEGAASVLALAHGGELISGSAAGTVIIWDINAPKRLAERAFGKSEVMDAKSVNDHEVIVALKNGEIHQWNWKTDGSRRLEPSHLSGAGAVAVSSDGQLVATGATNGQVYLRWLNTGVWQMLDTRSGPISDLQFSKDSRRLITVGQRGIIRIWPLPPTARVAFSDWLEKHTPWSVNRDGTLEAKPLPPISDAFGGPEPPRPTQACIDACRKAEPNDAPPNDRTMETCVLNKRIDACKN